MKKYKWLSGLRYKPAFRFEFFYNTLLIRGCFHMCGCVFSNIWDRYSKVDHWSLSWTRPIGSLNLCRSTVKMFTHLFIKPHPFLHSSRLDILFILISHKIWVVLQPRSFLRVIWQVTCFSIPFFQLFHLEKAPVYRASYTMCCCSRKGAPVACILTGFYAFRSK